MPAAELPVVWANYVSISGFVLLSVLVWLIPKKLIYAQAPDQAKWRDIRLWASALILLQVTLYVLFQ